RDARAAGVRAAVTLWAGRVDAQLAPEVWEFLKADDAELLPYDVQGTLLHAERLHAAGLLDDADLADVRATLPTPDSVDPPAGHARPPPACVVGDARARSGSLRIRKRAGSTVTARLRGARGIDTAAAAAAAADAQQPRRRRRPGLRPRLPLRRHCAVHASLAD